MQSALSDVSLLASLDLEVAHITGCNVSIENIELSIRGGWVDPISDRTLGASTVHKPGDQITYLYRLRPELTYEGIPIHGSDGHVLLLKINAKVLVSGQCRPNIEVEWRTAVDFTAEHSPNLLKAAHRLSNPIVQPSKAPNPDALLTQEEQSQQGEDAKIKVINVTLTISGPPRVQVGDIFHWDVFIVNRSEKSRKLAVLTIPKRKRELDRHKSHPSTSSVGGTHSDRKDLIAGAVVDENIVYAKQKSARIEVAESICLTTDVRIG